MLSDNVRQFLAINHNAVLTTYRRNGSAQMSIVTCGLYGDGVAFTVSGVPAKLANLRRDPRCSILVSQPDWWGYVVLQGAARLFSPATPTPRSSAKSSVTSMSPPRANNTPTGKTTTAPSPPTPAAPSSSSPKPSLCKSSSRLETPEKSPAPRLFSGLVAWAYSVVMFGRRTRLAPSPLPVSGSPAK